MPDAAGVGCAQAGAMTLALAGGLVLLALLDSTSFGTLLIPIWLMLSPGRLRAGRVVGFLAVVAGFYFMLGVALTAGLGQLLELGNGWAEHPIVLRGQLVLGIALFVLSFFIGKKKGPGEQRRPGRLMHWRERAMSGQRPGGALVALALGAAVLEVATMLPYLGAIGLLATADLGLGARTLMLAGYCLVMVAPALVLLAARWLAHDRIEPVLRRISDWMETKGGEATAWIVGIVGFLLARDALGRMPEVLDLLSGLG